MTQRLARRAEDRFITTSPGEVVCLSTRSAGGVDGDAVSGDRIENGHGQSSPLRHRVNAVPSGFDQDRL